MPRCSSGDRVKQLVQQEGKSARNLVAWSVPVAGDDSKCGYLSGVRTEGNHAGRLRSNRRHLRNRSGRATPVKAGDSNHDPHPSQEARRDTGEITNQEKKLSLCSIGQTSLSEQEEICKYYSIKTQRQSSLKLPSKLNLQARYWSYLFNNLHRAVDELYRTCEADESAVECQVGWGCVASVYALSLSFLCVILICGL